MADEMLDIVVFGASGFTGKCVVEELYRINKYYEQDLKWGIAGRSQKKLEKVIDDIYRANLDEYLLKIEIIVADVNDEASLKAMCKRSKLILNCCGPYRFYGDTVVKVCVENGSHHIDVSGEPAYMEEMQLKYDESAKKAGIYVISACGFDCIPTDMGVVYMKNNFEGDLNSVESYLKVTMTEGKGQGNAMFNFATWESLVHSLSKVEDMKRVRKLLFPNKIPRGRPILKDKSVHKNTYDKKWYVPLPGADRAVVNRTQRFLYNATGSNPIQFNAYVSMPSLFHVILGAFCGILLAKLSKYSIGRKMLLNYPRVFSFGLVSKDGPREENMKNLQFVVRLTGEGWSDENKERQKTDKKFTVEITGVNPMYGATAIASIFCAITLLKEQDKIPGSGGVLTPGAAFGNTSLIDKLTEHCMKFQVIEYKTIKSKL